MRLVRAPNSPDWKLVSTREGGERGGGGESVEGLGGWGGVGEGKQKDETKKGTESL